MQKIVKSFAREYGAQIPGRVYLQLPNGATWFGNYVPDTECIEGLDNFMLYYNIKPYHVVALEYRGSSRFGVEIFSCYAVEIDYGLKDIPFELGNLTQNHLGCDIREMLTTTDCEIEKFCSTLSFNAKSTWSAAYEFFITENHVVKQKFYEVQNFYIF